MYDIIDLDVKSMANIFDYVKKYGDKTFDEKKFNELDNVVFSLLTYLDFTDTDINKIENSTIEIIGNQYLELYKLKEVKKYGFSEKAAYKILEAVKDKKRYKNIILDDYVYINENMQFSALTFKISNKLIYISFEGTDHLMNSWKESLSLVYKFPVNSHIEAIKYLNKHIKLFGPNVIVGGHSKGGNLALISSMYTKRIKKFKIKKIYSNDGPGLRLKQYNSIKYKSIKKKYIHYIPSNSMIGILLKSDNHVVVKTRAISFFSHTMSTWSISDDKFILSELDKRHKRLEKNIENWLAIHDDEDRKRIICTIFDVLDKNNISDTMSLLKLKNTIKIIKELKNIDDYTKKITTDFLKYIFFS